MTHTLRLLHYTGPPIQDPVDPTKPPFTPQSVYVVGYRAMRQNIEVWTPMVFSLTINRAIELVNILNGGEAPVDIKQWFNVMTMETPTGVVMPPIAGADPNDFPRWDQWPAEEIPLPPRPKVKRDEKTQAEKERQNEAENHPEAKGNDTTGRA